MWVTDPIVDYLTRLRNAIMAGHKIVEIPASNIKEESAPPMPPMGAGGMPGMM